MNHSTSIGLAAACLVVFLITAAAGAAEVHGPSAPGGKNGPGQGAGGGQSYTTTQTLSDEAQENTLAFDALAFLTGDACSDTFLPPGKVADYAGFQYLRDNDATQMGHNTDFVTRASDNVLVILDGDQLAQFAALAKEEDTLSSRYAYMRFPLMQAFRSQLAGTLPAGSEGLDREAVMAYSARLYDVDASISLGRARTYAAVITSLNESQRATLDRMASGGMLTWPEADASAVLQKAGQGSSVAMRTYASEMFSWYAGSVDRDVYFCPERQATYFGSFYLKDRPAMGNPGYSISTTLTGDSGASFLDALTDSQRGQITGLVDLQRQDLQEIVATRTAIATELRRALTGGTIDEQKVRDLSARYGELDGEISYWYATRFAAVGRSLTAEQEQKLADLRNLDGYTCSGAYLYSREISMPQDVPSDFLFGAGAYDDAALSAWIAAREQANPSREPAGGNAGPGLDTGDGKNRPGGPGARGGNTTATGQGPAQVQEGGKARPEGQGTRSGTTPSPGQTTGQGQERRIPPGAVIARLGQEGYDVSGAADAVEANDREAMKAWLDAFRKEHPGVVEGIERGSGSANGESPRGQPGLSPQGILETLFGWLFPRGTPVP